MRRILVVRLGAMGDIIHTLPAVATLRRSFPDARITWLMEPRWKPLVEANPHVDEVAGFDRAGGLAGMWRSAAALRPGAFDLGIDFQGLWKSSLALRVSGASERWGRLDPREAGAAWFYTRKAEVEAGGGGARHIVDQHLALAQAAGAHNVDRTFPIPPGVAEPDSAPLPSPGRFVLACPQAGWGSKQWPESRYAELALGLARRFGWPLVLNLPPGVAWPDASNTVVHRSGIAGLIDATRKAGAVVGVDSGPLHLAAALEKPGVAIFGPTDPARNGPYGGSLTVVRAHGAETTYRRDLSPASAMRSISAEEVLDLLEPQLHPASGSSAEG